MSSNPPAEKSKVERSSEEPRARSGVRGAQGKRARRVMQWIRKIHMYLGLLLFPWVLFFGISGMLFNHPDLGAGPRERSFSADELAEHAVLSGRDPSAMAQEVVAALAEGGQRYRLDPSYEARFRGAAAFTAPDRGEEHLLLLDLEDGEGVVRTRALPSRSRPAPFAGELDLPEHRVAVLEEPIAGLFSGLRIRTEEAPRVHSRMSPSLRFRMTDAEGVAWNVSYDLVRGQVDGRRADRAPSLSIPQLLGSMHKTHRFPPQVGPQTFWVLLADLTGLTLVIWALTGLLMWIQLKRYRALGVVALSLGLLLAVIVMLSMHEELHFGGSSRGGPPPRRAPSAPSAAG